jgi:hypothetical protein
MATATGMTRPVPPRWPRAALTWAWALGLALCVLDAALHPQAELRHQDTLSTARLAMALQVFAWCRLIVTAEARTTRLVWTLGAATLVVHIVMAFGLAHGWSHQAAVDRVREVGGFGGGILVSYTFVLVWLGDAAWWWLAPAGRARRPRWVAATVHGFLAFVTFNATEVYVTPGMRVIYAAAFGGPLAACLAWRMTRTDRTAPPVTGPDQPLDR